MNKPLLRTFYDFRKLAEGPWWRRFFHRPVLYPATMLHTYLLFPVWQREWVRKAVTFWGREISMPLPAGLDIFLAGGKGHDSELRLALWMIRNLSGEEIALDVGAHLGYYSLLMAACMEGRGKVCAFEPGKETFAFLRVNTAADTSIRIFPCAVSGRSETISFVAHPVDQSESNHILRKTEAGAPTVQQGQTYNVQAVSLDDWVLEHPCNPTFIKIDTEGSEPDVLRGAGHLLETCRPRLVLEFHPAPAKRAPYLEAAEILAGIGYRPLEILQDGTTRQISNLNTWADQQSLDSDNLLFLPATG